MDPAASAAAVKASIATYELAKRQGWVDRLSALFKEKHHVLLLGSTGVGKSNFLDSLEEDLPAAIHYLNRTVTNEHHSLKISEKDSTSLFVFHDTPGEAGLKGKRNEAYKDHLGRTNSGIVNVVAYGYHEYKAGAAQVDAKSATIDEAYLARHRAIELEAAKEWIDLLITPGTTSWILTVITKADLWWDRQEEVRSYYSSGPYAQLFAPHRWVAPVTVDYCSVLHKFYSAVPLSGWYDDEDRTRSRGNMMSSLMTLSSQHQ